jgi:hypothetical protein
MVLDHQNDHSGTGPNYILCCGSVTGQDGEGAGQQDFVSGREWSLVPGRWQSNERMMLRLHVQPGYTFTGKTYAMGMN